MFLVLVIAFAAIIYLCRLYLPWGAKLWVLTWTPVAADAMQMWSVGLAGLVTVLAMEGSPRGIGFGGAPPRYFLIAFCLPIAYCAAIYLPCWLSGVASFKGTSILLYGIAASAVHLPLHFVMATGEEIGWRGNFAPNLAGILGPVRAGLASGVAWAAWHYLDILYFGYNVGTPPVFAISCFTISLVGMAMFLTWLRLSSRSVWPPALFHGVHNAAIYGIFERATASDETTAYFTTEFGVGLALASTILGLVSWRLMRRPAFADRVLVA